MTGTDAIRLLLADVDGRLVTPDKELTDRAVAAVRRLGDAGILFAITRSRPPRGLSVLIEPLNIMTPIAAFNGGLQHVLPQELVVPVADLIGSFGLDASVNRHLRGPRPARGSCVPRPVPALLPRRRRRGTAGYGLQRGRGLRQRGREVHPPPIT